MGQNPVGVEEGRRQGSAARLEDGLLDHEAVVFAPKIAARWIPVLFFLRRPDEWNDHLSRRARPAGIGGHWTTAISRRPSCNRSRAAPRRSNKGNRSRRKPVYPSLVIPLFRC